MLDELGGKVVEGVGQLYLAAQRAEGLSNGSARLERRRGYVLRQMVTDRLGGED